VLRLNVTAALVVNAVNMNEPRTARKQVLFIHGGGENGYEADAALAASLRRELGPDYEVRYPQMPDEPSPDFGWGQKIDEEIAAIEGELFLVGHSLGASMLLKFLSENQVRKRIGGIFLIATPFWTGDEDWKKGLLLRDRFAAALPKGVPIFLYHSQDDEEADVSHLDIYAAKLPQATVRKVSTGGHQLGNDLARVARDIRQLG
jgi:predicted alpha/beta hydrolase family esterase